MTWWLRFQLWLQSRSASYWTRKGYPVITKWNWQDAEPVRRDLDVLSIIECDEGFPFLRVIARTAFFGVSFHVIVLPNGRLEVDSYPNRFAVVHPRAFTDEQVLSLISICTRDGVLMSATL